MDTLKARSENRDEEGGIAVKFYMNYLHASKKKGLMAEDPNRDLKKFAKRMEQRRFATPNPRRAQRSQNPDIVYGMYFKSIICIILYTVLS